MPLQPGCSQEAVSANIAELIRSGKPPDVAAAIAYDQCKGEYTPDEWVKLLAFMQASKGALSFTGATVKADSAGRFEGHLVRYGSPSDSDLDNEWFSANTYFMLKNGYPIKGAPVNYQHGLDSDFGAFNMGIFDLVEEDDIGLLVEAQLHNYEDYIAMLKELGRLKQVKISKAQLDHKANLAVKAVNELVATVPMKMSMGADPAAFYVNPDTGHIDICGIVHGALTPTPADDKQPLVQFKSAWQNITDLTPDTFSVTMDNVISATDGQATKADVPDSATGTPEDVGVDMSRIDTILTDNLKSNNNSEEFIPMNKEELLEKIAKQLDPILEEILEQVNLDVDKEGEEELLDEMLGKAEEDLPKDEEEIKAIEDEEEVVEIVKANVKNWLPDAIKAHMEKQAQEEARHKSLAAEIIEGAKSNAPAHSYKKQRGGFAEKNVNVHTGKAEKPLTSLVKSQLRGAPQKGQNPYIGPLGGVLVGEQLSTEILEMLRPKVVMFDAGVRQTSVTGIGAYTVPKMTTAPTAFRPGINTAITGSEGKFAVVTAYLRPIAAVIDIPRQMLLTTQTNVEEYLRNEMERSIRLQIDKEILIGVANVVDDTGAEIKGIRTVLEADSALSSTNISTLATNGRKPKYTDLIAAETQVATGNVELDGETSGWVMHPRTRGTFRSLTTSTGEPLLYDNYSKQPYQDMIGYKVHQTTQLPVNETTGTGSDTSSIFFGNYRYGEYVMGNNIEFIVDEMTLANYLNIRITAYLYSDFIVHYPEAFYVMKGVRA